METLLSIIHVLVSIFMVLVILLQAGKSGGMGGLGAGGAAVFGARGSQTLLGKITTICAAIFMITSLSLAWFSSRSSSLLDNAALPTEEVAPSVEEPSPAEVFEPAEEPLDGAVEEEAAE